MKNAVFCDFTPCGSCKIRRIVGTYHLHHEGDKNKLVITLSVTSNRSRLLVTDKVVPSLPIIVTLMIRKKNSSETSVLTRAARRKITEYGILHM
jgi:hypothetical protein